MIRCPFCGDILEYVDYGGYYNPPEWYERCVNPKCKKYERSYFYYDGFYLKLDKWERQHVEYNSLQMKEFFKRVDYHKKRKRKTK